MRAEPSIKQPGAPEPLEVATGVDAVKAAYEAKGTVRAVKAAMGRSKAAARLVVETEEANRNRVTLLVAADDVLGD